LFKKFQDFRTKRPFCSKTEQRVVKLGGDVTVLSAVLLPSLATTLTTARITVLRLSLGNQINGIVRRV
jgi:hypothetical protein